MGVIKRKKGKQEYFYLQYSFRKEGRVITREKYLGKKIPRNIEKIRQELKKEGQEVLYEKLEKIRKDFQKEWKKVPESIKEKEKEEIAIAFTYNTNAIEGSTITLEETQEIIHDKIAPNKSLNDIKETETHYKLFLKILDKKEKISNKLLLEWHKNIFSESKEDIVGKFRDYLVRVGSYVAPDWQDIKRLMNELIRVINQSKINPVELTAMTHYRFEKIHPFGDGNGRIGRLLMNHILWHNKYPMLIIEYKKRKSYYRALNGDEKGFVKYFLKRYLSVHRRRYS